MNKISKRLAWLGPYLNLAQTVIPKIKRLKSIQLIHPKEKCLNRIYGALTHRTDNLYSMTLYIQYNTVVKLYPNAKLKRKDFSQVDILSVFAHELAHLIHWHHTPQHKMLEAKLTILFMARLAESGYISEENECKQQGKSSGIQFYRCK